MIEWKDITATKLIPGKAYRIKIIDNAFDNICLYVGGGCFIFYDETKPGALGCIERKVVFSVKDGNCETELTRLSESLRDSRFDFNDRKFETTNKRTFETFTDKLYDLLSEDKIFEVTTHCF